MNVDFGSIHSTKITALPWTQQFISFGGEPVPISEEDLTNVLVFEKGRGKSPSSEQAPEVIVKSIPHELAVVLWKIIQKNEACCFYVIWMSASVRQWKKPRVLALRSLC